MNFEKQKLTWIKSEQKKSKAGKDYTSVSIKTDRYGDKFLSGFGSKENRDWKVGDEIEIVVHEVESNGKIYLNFEHKREPKADEKIATLESRVVDLEETVENIRKFLKPIYEERKGKDTPPGRHYPTPDDEGINLDDIQI
jgi:hypothetical protein